VLGDAGVVIVCFLASFPCVAVVAKDGGVIGATFGRIHEEVDTNGVVSMICAVFIFIEVAEVGEFFDAARHCILAYWNVQVGDSLGKIIGEFGRGALIFLVLHVPSEKACLSWGAKGMIKTDEANGAEADVGGYLKLKPEFAEFEGLVTEGEVIHFVGMDVQLEITFSFVGAGFIVGEGELFPE